MKLRGETWILATLSVTTTAIALYAYAIGRASWLEVLGFVTGALCVWLTVKQSVWNFPISLLTVSAFFFVFARAHLYADTGLQVVYFVLTLHGWYLWLYGGKQRTPLRVGRVPAIEAACVAAAGIAMTLGLTFLLRHVGGSMTFWDALTTALSLCAQWLLNRKYLESWYCWIVVDVIYIPLYLSKSLYLTSILYGVFLCMATIGLIEWWASWRKDQAAARFDTDEAAVAAVAPGAAG